MSKNIDNTDFIDEYTKIQREYKAKQERVLDQLYDSVLRVKHIAEDIGNELDNQNRTLEELDEHVNDTSMKIVVINKKLDKLNGDDGNNNNGLLGWLWKVITGRK